MGMERLPYKQTASQTEENLEFVSRLDNETTETFDITQEEEKQDVQQEVHLEKLMEQLDKLNLSGLFFQDEAETSEEDDQEVMGSTLLTRVMKNCLPLLNPWTMKEVS